MRSTEAQNGKGRNGGQEPSAAFGRDQDVLEPQRAQRPPRQSRRHGRGNAAFASRIWLGWVVSGDGSVAQGRVLACLVVGVCIFVLWVYLPALSARATLLDDAQYVSKNPLVQNPSWRSVRRFFGEVRRPSTVRGYYQPLTMVSLMVDRYLGAGPDDLSAYHRTSLLLHLGNTALLGVLIYLLFREPVIAAGMALLFGVHPMTVDSVCWLSERKTLLASFFALTALILYVRFAQRRQMGFYLGCLFAYVLALLSKPITVPLPAMMLLMDYWPLGRLGRRGVVEKLPLFAIGGVFAVITYVSQSGTAGVHWPARSNPLYVSTVLCHNVIFYLRKLILPLNLSPHYEPPNVIGFANPAFAASMIVCLFLVLSLVLLRRHTPAPLIGSLIFFVMLLPATGPVRAAYALVANRYVYLPSIGLLLVLAWLLVQWRRGLRKRRLRASYLAVPLVILVLGTLGAVGTRRYLHPWSNTGELHQYMLRLFPEAPMVHNDLGLYLASNGRYREAIEHFRSALRTGPNLWQAHHNLAAGLDQTGGDTEEMVQHYRRAIELMPADMPARISLGLALCHRGDWDRGLAALREAAEVGQRLRPPLARYALGYLLVLHGQTRAGLDCLRETLSVSPRFLLATKGLAWFLATHPAEAFRDAREAVLLAERARSITRGEDAGVLDVLAAAYASQGQYDKAVNTAKEAVRVSTKLGDSDSTEWIEKRLRLYETHRAYRLDPRAQLEEFMSETQWAFDDPQARLENLWHRGMAAGPADTAGPSLLGDAPRIGTLRGVDDARAAATPMIFMVGRRESDGAPDLGTPAQAVYSVLQLLDRGRTEALTQCFCDATADAREGLYPRYLGPPVAVVAVAEEGDTARVSWNATVHTGFTIEGKKRSPGETVGLQTRLVRVDGVWKLARLHEDSP